MAEGRKSMETALAIIGGGPAGLAAALAAREAGVEDILILERDSVLGGILNQCIHNGFGLHTFKEELTGPEYAYRFIKRVEEAGIPCLTDTMVVDLEEEEGEKYITAMNRKDGILTIRTKAIILAMGCRERPRGALNIPGFRPAGVYSAGTAQRLVNIEGKMPGRDVVILGSGDIGLIMARRMTLEGAKVHTVAEIMPYSGGLKRNIVQCLDDFGIPLKLSTTVVKIHGKERVEGVTLAKVDERMKPISGTEEYIPCDTLLLSVGLLPENELTEELGAKMSPVTRGPLVNESMETSLARCLCLWKCPPCPRPRGFREPGSGPCRKSCGGMAEGERKQCHRGGPGAGAGGEAGDSGRADAGGENSHHGRTWRPCALHRSI